MIKGRENKDGGFKLYTGLCDMEVVAFNPEVEQLREFFGGSDKTREPNYTSTGEDGTAKIRLDVWLKNNEHNIFTKMSIFLEDKDRISKEGKPQWINEVGQITWVDSPENLDPERQKYFNLAKKPRIAKVGEEELYEFLKAWTNIDQKADDSELKLDTAWSSIIGGNVSELNKYIPVLNRKVKVLLGVRDNKYQDVYSKVILKEGGTYIDTLQKNVTGQYAWKSNYQNSFKLQQFNPDMDAPVESTAKQATAEEIKAALKV